MQKELQEEIRKDKEQYKNKIESHFTYNEKSVEWHEVDEHTCKW